MRPCDHPTGEPQPDICHVCYKYVTDPRYKQLMDSLEWNAFPQERPSRIPENLQEKATPYQKKGGPGTELKKLLEELGVLAKNGCECDSRAATMNDWGIEGCRNNRDVITGWLKEGRGRWAWTVKLGAAIRALASKLAFRLDILDPYGSLVDEAIRRAEEKEISK